MTIQPYRCLQVRGDYSHSNILNVMHTIIIGMLIIVLRAIFLKLNWGWFSYQTSTRIVSKWQNVTLTQERGNIPTQISSQILKTLFYDFWEALQFEVVVPQLHTFRMDVHPPTHVQLMYIYCHLYFIIDFFVNCLNLQKYYLNVEIF